MWDVEQSGRDSAPDAPRLHANAVRLRPPTGCSTHEERCDMTSSLSSAASAHDPPAADIGEKLDWDAFSAQYFPGRKRHDLDAVAAYGAYKQGRDWRNSGRRTAPPRLTLVQNEPGSAPLEADPDGEPVERLRFAVAAVQVWEGEGGLPS